MASFRMAVKQQARSKLAPQCRHGRDRRVVQMPLSGAAAGAVSSQSRALQTPYTRNVMVLSMTPLHHLTNSDSSANRGWTLVAAVRWARKHGSGVMLQRLRGDGTMVHGRPAAPYEGNLWRASLKRTPIVLVRLLRRGQYHFS